MTLNGFLNNFVSRVNVVLRRIGLLGHGMIKNVLVSELHSFRELAVAIDINTDKSWVRIF